LLEVTGLAIWGMHLWRIMHNGATLEKANLTFERSLRPTAPITAQERVGDVLEHHPYLLNTFLSFGFHPLSNPWLRRTLARSVTLEQACRLLSVDIQELLKALNTGREKLIPKTFSLPVLEFDSHGHGGTSHSAPNIHHPCSEEARC
jgi:hypothetical protein